MGTLKVYNYPFCAYKLTETLLHCQRIAAIIYFFISLKGSGEEFTSSKIKCGILIKWKT